jgi:large subunit ribosomal protein L18
MATKSKQQKRTRRAIRTRARIHGTATRPRLSVFRSAKHFSAQLIDDDAMKTIASVSDKDVVDAENPTDGASKLGKLIGEKASKINVSTVVFDRGPYAYHGRVKVFADAARESGLNF